MPKMWAVIALVVVIGLVGWNLLREDADPSEQFDTEQDSQTREENDTDGG